MVSRPGNKTPPGPSLEPNDEMRGEVLPARPRAFFFLSRISLTLLRRLVGYREKTGIDYSPAENRCSAQESKLTRILHTRR